MSTCQQMAAYALDSWTAEDAREAALNVADPIMKDLL